MLIPVDTRFETESERRANPRPRSLLEIIMDDGSHYEFGYVYDRKSHSDINVSILQTGTVDRRYEIFGEVGASFAGQVTVTVSNLDKRFNPGNSSSEYYSGLLGKAAILHIFFDLVEDPQYMSEELYMADDEYMSDDFTDAVAVFTGIIEEIDNSNEGYTSIILKDALQPLVEATFPDTGYIDGTGVDIIKYLVETYSSINVDDYSYLVARKYAPGTEMRLTWELGDRVIDKISEVHKAIGTSCFADENNNLIIYRLGQESGEYLLAKRRDTNTYSMYDATKTGDRANFNVINSQSQLTLLNVVNRIEFTYTDWNGDERTYIVNDTESQNDYGVRLLQISTTVIMGENVASTWPRRIIKRFSQPKRNYSYKSTLRFGMLNQIGDIIVLTDPTHSESSGLFRMLATGKNVVETDVQIEVEDVENELDDKFAFAGSDIAGYYGDRRSDVLDFIHNKSFLYAKDPGVDDTPMRWNTYSGTGGALDVIDTDYKFDDKCVNWTSAAASRKWSTVLNLQSLTNNRYYYFSVYIKGTLTSGTPKIEVVDSVGTSLGSISITSSYASWTRISFRLTTNSNTPLEVVLDSAGATFDFLLDGIQIDFAYWNDYDLELGTIGSTPPGWITVKDGGTGFTNQTNGLLAHEGSQCMIVTNSLGFGHTYRLLDKALEPGSYTLSFYMYASTAMDTTDVSILQKDGTPLTTPASLNFVSGFTTGWPYIQYSIPFTVGDNDLQQLMIEIRTYNSVNASPRFDLFDIATALNVDEFKILWSSFAYASKSDGDANPGFDSDGNVNGQIDPGYMEGFEDHYKA